MSRVRFIELLKEYDIPIYKYTEEDFEKDQQVIAEYHKKGERWKFSVL